MIRPLALRTCFATALALLAATAAGAVNLPPDFVVEDVAPGAGFNTPTGVAFLPGGRMLVAEKRGRVYAVTNGVKYPTPLWSRENEVLNNGDRGLLGIAVDSDYVANHFIYLLYTVDPDSNGNDNNGDAFARLARYTVSLTDSNVVDYASRTLLLGASWRTGMVSASPSHTIGSLRWGRDRSLLVSVGDGAQFNSMDQGGQDAGAFGATKTDPYEDIGAFRSQYTGSLAGKILRLDPANGLGYSSNPYYDGNPASNASRVWAYGLRNPFRFTVRPGTGAADPALGQPGTLYVGDVGWNAYEECDIAAVGGINFGWPCFEGFLGQGQYQAGTPSHNDCSSFGTPTNPAPASAPAISWHHSNAGLSTPSGFTGNTSIGGVFYLGTRYPAPYRQQYFFGDYGQNWIKVAVMDANDQLLNLLDFADAADGPVDFALEPGSGDLVYVSIASGQVRRIRYTGIFTNTPPVAFAAGAPNVGVAPLSVSFSSAGSFDPDGDPFTTTWLFGDGRGSTSPDPTHVYGAAGTYDAVLILDDGQGGLTRDTVVVVVVTTAGFPTTPVLDDFNRPNGPIGSPWVDDVAHLAIDNNVLTETCCSATTVWNGGTFGPDQEAFVTFGAVTTTPSEHDLMLKVQGQSWASGHIEVRYNADVSSIAVSTFDLGGGWVGWGTISPLAFQAGDQLGARAYSNGLVEVYKNGVKMGSISVAGWPFSAQGGRIGMTISDAVGSRLDNFGGGTAVFDLNTPPMATITTPLPDAFYATGDTVKLTGTASDAQDPPASLTHTWEMDVHHNNHIHPSFFVSDSASAYFIGEDHDDGTGVFLAIRHIVTDGGGLSDTATVNIHPEVDLSPSAVTTVPSTPGTTAGAEYRFTIHNTGRMRAPIFRWRLTADATLLAEGDTLVPAQDSAKIVRGLPPTLVAGPHTLRVVVDTLGTVAEVSEADNAATRGLTVVTGPGPDEFPPQFTAGPTSEPWGVFAYVRWHTSEPSTGVARFGSTPDLGDSVTTPQDTAHVATLGGLSLGQEVFFRVVAIDTAGNAATSAPDSFTTQTGPLAVGEPPLRFALSNARPNPSRGPVVLMLELPRPARVAFHVYDLLGREVWRDDRGELSAGRWSLEWPGTSTSGARARPGIYLARVNVDGRDYVKRLALLR